MYWDTGFAGAACRATCLEQTTFVINGWAASALSMCRLSIYGASQHPAICARQLTIPADCRTSSCCWIGACSCALFFVEDLWSSGQCVPPPTDLLKFFWSASGLTRTGRGQNDYFRVEKWNGKHLDVFVGFALRSSCCASHGYPLPDSQSPITNKLGHSLLSHPS